MTAPRVRLPCDWPSIEKAIGQTPCLCGALNTWHFECYRGATQADIDAALPFAYIRAKQELRRRARAARRLALEHAKRDGSHKANADN